MSHNFSMPDRSSSKRASADVDVADSFDPKHWTILSEIFDIKAKRSLLNLKLLQDELADGSASKENGGARRLLEEIHLHSLQADILRKQASRVEVKPGEEEDTRRGYFMQLWTTSTKGLGVLCSDIGREKRSRKTQERFREELIAACNSGHPDPRSDELWCPVLRHFFPNETMHAAHIFPWTEGQLVIDEIFRREVKEVEELNEVDSGLLLSTYAKNRLDDGDVVLVPDVADMVCQEELDKWSKSEPKDFRIKVVNPGAKGMNRLHPGYFDRKTWNDLDGKRVQFSSDHRPRARYLYWQYCKTMLRESCTEKGIQAKDVQMQKLWGPKGPYIKKRTLLAFVEQLGPGYEALMENAIVESEDDDIPESDPSALLLASAEICASHRKYREEDEEESESEESDDDEDDESA